MQVITGTAADAAAAEAQTRIRPSTVFYFALKMGNHATGLRVSATRTFTRDGYAPPQATRRRCARPRC